MSTNQNHKDWMAKIAKIKSDLNQRLDKHQVEAIQRAEKHHAEFKADLRKLERAQTEYYQRISKAENTLDQIKSDFTNYTDHVRFELQGANEDHLSMHDDKLDDHEERITVLETG